MSAESIPEPNEIELITKWMIAEYKLLTNEIIEFEKGGYQILATSGALSGAALTAGASLWAQPIPSSLIFNVIVPLILVSFSFIWINTSLSTKDNVDYLIRFSEGKAQDILGQSLQERLKKRRSPTTLRYSRVPE